MPLDKDSSQLNTAIIYTPEGNDCCPVTLKICSSLSSTGELLLLWVKTIKQSANSNSFYASVAAYYPYLSLEWEGSLKFKEANFSNLSSVG